MRAARVNEVLEAGRHMTVVDMMNLQMDELSVPARNIVPLLRNLEGLDGMAERARRMLLDWDYVLDKDSVEASIYVSWERRLRDNVKAAVVPREALDLFGRINTKRVIDWLVAPDGRFGLDPIGGRDAILRNSLVEALAGLIERFGAPDMTTWRYGGEKFKHAVIRHPLSGAVDIELGRQLDVGPFARVGTGVPCTTPAMATTRRPARRS